MPFTHKLSENSVQKNIQLMIVSLFWFAQYVYIPYQATYLSSIGVASSYVGIIVGAYGFSQLILRMPVGLMADIKGKHKPFIMTGVLLAGTASLFRFFSPNELGFFIASLLSGFSSAMWISFMVLYFSCFSKEEQQKASSIIVAANNIGILAGFVAGTLLHDRYGIRFLCILSVLAAVPALIFSLLIREPERSLNPLPVKKLVLVYADKRLILFSLLALVQQGIQMSTSMSFTTQVAQKCGAGSIQIGICSIIYILAAVLSSYFASSKIAQIGGAPFWIPAIFLCLTAYCFLVPILPSVEWIWIVQILSGLSTGILFSFCTSEAMKGVPSSKASTAMGYYQAIYAIGMTVFPVMTGIIAKIENIGSAFDILSVIAFLGFIIAVLFYQFECRAHSREY